MLHYSHDHQPFELLYLRFHRRDKEEVYFELTNLKPYRNTIIQINIIFFVIKFTAVTVYLLSWYNFLTACSSDEEQWLLSSLLFINWISQTLQKLFAGGRDFLGDLSFKVKLYLWSINGPPRSFEALVSWCCLGFSAAWRCVVVFTLFCFPDDKLRVVLQFDDLASGCKLEDTFAKK